MSRPKIRIGYFDKTCRTPLFYPHDSHLILCAPAGSGKGRDILIPALALYEGSSVVIDPKGQLASVVGPSLAQRGHRVFVLNPYRILEPHLQTLIHAGFNPLASLNPKAASFGSDCDSLAEAIVFHDGGSDSSHWVDSARQLISGVIMMLVAHCPRRKRNLVTLYEIISGARLFEFAQMAVKTGDIMICGRLGRFAAPKASENKELSGIISTAITQCSFIGNKAISESLTAANDNGPALRFADLRQTPTVVFLVLPTRYLATSAKWFRLVIAAAMADLLQEERGSLPVLGMLDEFAQLGTLKIMSDIMGIGRGYGLQIFPVLQDLNQLRELYPQRWETFLANSGAQIFFAPRDLTSAKWISERAGDMQVDTPAQQSVSESAWGPKNQVNNIGVSTSYGVGVIPYLKPHQVAEIGGDEMLVFGENLPGVIRAGRRSYLKMPEMRGKFSPDPYHPAEKRRWA